MSVIEKITPILKEKLQPHAKRIADGNANDHDYLPAMLLTCIEGNSQNVAVIKGLVDSSNKNVEIIKNLVDSNNQLISQSNENITLTKALNNKINILTIATALFGAITLAMIIYQMLNK
jgi:hypothetical protein